MFICGTILAIIAILTSTKNIVTIAGAANFSPILLAGMVVGLVVGIFQSVTQIQEMTLTFIPKMAAIILVILFLMPWMLTTLTDFATSMYHQMSMISK